VDVILPCLDEAPALPWVLGRMPAGFRAIVVDNGSTDGSERLAATADLVCFCDCDGSLDPQQLPRLAGPPLAGEAASAAGWRLAEVEVAYLPRIGKSKVTGTVHGSVRTVRDMSRVLAR
jgi:glycosyltransferase involved in cell wall biosynthesis